MKNLPKLPEVPSFDLTGKKALVVVPACSQHMGQLSQLLLEELMS